MLQPSTTSKIWNMVIKMAFFDMVKDLNFV